MKFINNIRKGINLLSGISKWGRTLEALGNAFTYLDAELEKIWGKEEIDISNLNIKEKIKDEQ